MNRLLVTLILVLVLVASFVTLAKANAAVKQPSVAADNTVPLVVDTTGSTPPATPTNPPARHRTGSVRAKTQAQAQSPRPDADDTTTAPSSTTPSMIIEYTGSDNTARTLTMTYDATSQTAVGVIGVKDCLTCQKVTLTPIHASLDDLNDAAKTLLASIGGKASTEAAAELDPKAKKKAEHEAKVAEMKKLLCETGDVNDHATKKDKKEKVQCLLDHYDELEASDDEDADGKMDKIMDKLVAIYKPIRMNMNNLSERAKKQAQDLLDILTGDDSSVAGKRVLALIDASIVQDAQKEDLAAFQQASALMAQAIALKSLPMYQAAFTQYQNLLTHGTQLSNLQSQLAASARSYVAAANDDADSKVSLSEVKMFNNLITPTNRAADIAAMEKIITTKTNNKVNASTVPSVSTDPYVNIANAALANVSATAAASSATGDLNLGTPAALSAFVARDTDACGGKPCDPRAPAYGWGALGSFTEPSIYSFNASKSGVSSSIPSQTVASGSTGLLNANLVNSSNGLINIPSSNINSTAGTLNATNTAATSLRSTGRGGMLLQ